MEGQIKSLGQGSAPVSDAILGLAQGLMEQFPEPICLLTGIALTDPRKGRRVTSDLIGVTRMALFVGVDAGRDSAGITTPTAVARLLADLLQREQMVSQPLPIYAFWLGDAIPEGFAADVPVLPDAGRVQGYILLTKADGIRLSEEALVSLAEDLLRQDTAWAERKRSAVSHLRHAVLGLARIPGRIDGGLQEQIRRPFVFLRSKPILPADASRYLEKAMLAPENALEDADYVKIVPNDFVVELNENNYKRNYEPIEQNVCERWQAKLLEALNTTNDRRGRREYGFGGHVRVQVRPVSDLAEGELRIWCQISPDMDTVFTAAWLELIPDGRGWPLEERIVTIGRDEICDICLDMPDARRVRLVSGQHARILQKDGEYRLYDGSPDGRRSTNGTFVNGQQVGAEGKVLDDGDVIILAALDSNQPRSDTPGAVTFIFHMG
jgi:hypothetical protein